MLQAEDCQRRADECARLAAATTDEQAAARYRYLELSWLYLLRLKLRKKHPLPGPR
jgi:hypothetical protein